MTSRSRAAGRPAPLGRSRREGGFALVEAIIAIMLVAVVLVAGGMTYLVAERSFKWGAKKLVAQQEATLLSRAITRTVRGGAYYHVYQLPDRVTQKQVGNGLEVRYRDGTVHRYEWSNSQKTVVDKNAKRATSMELAYVEFRVDPVRPSAVRFKFATVDGQGSLVDMESSASLRN